MMNRKGFTLIELLIVVVIIGILAAIAIPKFATTKDKAKLASVKTDIRNYMTAEEAYFSDKALYGDAAALAGAGYNFTFSAGNAATASSADAAGYSLTVQNATATLFSDTGANDTYNATTATVTPNAGDKQLTASVGFISGNGVTDLGPASPIGAFVLNLAPILSADGLSFFTAPRPFYIQANLSGQFIPTGFNPGATTQTLLLSDTANVIFSGQVPEPATMSLMGLGLVALARRRYAQKRAQ